MNRRQVIGVIVSTAVVAVGTAAVALNRPGASSAPQAATPALEAAAGPAAVPAKAAARKGPPVKVRRHTLDIAPAGREAHTLQVPERRTATFSLLGITWTDPSALVTGTVQVRTRAAATGAWSAWRTLDADDSLGPDTAAERGHHRGGTAPLWVGPADGVAARVVDAASGTSRALPAGLRLELLDPTAGGSARGTGSGGQGGGDEVDPGGSPAPEQSATQEPSADPVPSASASTPAAPASTAPETTSPAPAVATTAPVKPAPPAAAPRIAAKDVPATGMPAYVSRAAWQADESLVKDTPTYATNVGVVFVHHTATGDYQCADSASIVRGILAYHVQSQGWNDIGYNFLADKCGTLFEGRKGGVDKAVVGAHTYGFNTGSAGIAVLGTYTDAPVTDAAKSAVAQLAGYKLGMYGFDPNTSTQLTEGVSDGKFPKGTVVTFARISGHRDGVATECPGDALYAQLGDIRTAAGAGVYGLTATPGGAVFSGGTYYVRGPATLNWSVATPSTVLTRFDLLVDGAVAGTAPGDARSASVPVPAGSHKVQVRAVRDNGATATSAPSTVLMDSAAPTFPGYPDVVLRGGTVSTTSVPVTLTFRAADNVQVASLALTAPSARTFGPTTTSWAATATPNTATAWRMTAKDVAGNAGNGAVTRTPVLVPETWGKRAGKWGAASNGSYLGGKALTSSTRNAKVTWTFTGRSAALVFARTSKSGKVDIYLDGRKVGTLDLKSGATSYRQAMWTRNVPSGKHTVAIVVQATKGRPSVTTDGLVYTR
ncbi:N-acetylmuramoyl-L-alanine amidase [Krasilnikovia sp. MM14-A1259]|uniref:N-acetylmuramoyl-L-alanine amidase n=1 Tax=Krasilnikovia sp. MM14-A1259 TaxID=3373539 RepID=UPI00399C7EE9